MSVSKQKAKAELAEYINQKIPRLTKEKSAEHVNQSVNVLSKERKAWKNTTARYCGTNTGSESMY